MPATCDPPAAGVAWLPLTVALLIMFGVTVYPPLLQRADGSADHLALSLLGWAMAAGFTRGVGLIPRHPLPRLMLSTSATLLAFAGGLALIVRGG